MCEYAHSYVLLQFTVFVTSMLRYEPVPSDKHVPPKTRALSMETAMTITMWTVIVAFVTMVATLSLVTYNAFQLSTLDDVTCTLEEYSQLQWVTVPKPLAKQLPRTLLYRESANSPVTKGTAVIPDTQKTTCAEKMHHAAPKNTDLSQQQLQLSPANECPRVTSPTINLRTTPITYITYTAGVPSYSTSNHISANITGVTELSLPADGHVCKISNLPSNMHITSFVYYSTESGNNEDAFGDSASVDWTTILDFPKTMTYLGIFDENDHLLHYMSFPLTVDAHHIWSMTQKTIEDSNNVDVHLYNVRSDSFRPSTTISNYRTDNSTTSKVIAVDMEIKSDINGLFISDIYDQSKPSLITFDFDDYTQVVLSSQ
jgi:hypothetical protein